MYSYDVIFSCSLPTLMPSPDYSFSAPPRRPFHGLRMQIGSVSHSSPACFIFTGKSKFDGHVGCAVIDFRTVFLSSLLCILVFHSFPLKDLQYSELLISRQIGTFPQPDSLLRIKQRRRMDNIYALYSIPEG